MSRISNYIANVYGSKRGLLQYLSCLAKDSVLNSYGKNKILPDNVNRVVFVCKGNVCRSAVAEGCFKLNNDIDCCSVGLDTTSGNGANERILELSRAYGISLDEHITTSIEDFEPAPGDLFICMEPNQVEQLEQKIGHHSVVLLGFFGSPQSAYIHDPYNANEIFAEDCIKYICHAVDCFSKRLNVTKKRVTS